MPGLVVAQYAESPRGQLGDDMLPHGERSAEGVGKNDEWCFRVAAGRPLGRSHPVL